jgi:hypothetical protein
MQLSSFTYSSDFMGMGTENRVVPPHVPSLSSNLAPYTRRVVSSNLSNGQCKHQSISSSYLPCSCHFRQSWRRGFRICRVVGCPCTLDERAPMRWMTLWCLLHQRLISCWSSRPSVVRVSEGLDEEVDEQWRLGICRYPRPRLSGSAAA